MLKKACIGLLALSILSNPAAQAAEITILPWMKEGSEMNLQYFTEALDTVKANAPSAAVTILWGWERIEPDSGEDLIDKEVMGVEHSISRGFSDSQYIAVTVIDTVKRVLPDDISELAWNDPILLKRYGEVLDRLKAKLPHSPDYFVVANEADVYFEKHPEEVAAFIEFASAAQKEIKARFPNAKTGITVTYEGLHKGGVRAEIVKKFLRISDKAFFTFYPVFEMKPYDPLRTPDLLDAMIAAAGSKGVVLQEVGYPSGKAGVYQDKQAEFYATIIPAIQQRQEIEFASIFALHDFDEKTCDMLTGYYGFGGLLGLTPWVRDFKDFICTLGLKDAQGQPKPAWSKAVQAFKEIKQDR